MRRRTLLHAALTAAAAAAPLPLTGCGPRGTDARPGLDYLSLAWQKESVDANKALVDAWNAAHPHTPVRYLQGSWESVHDQLLTSFEGGSAPDVIHDEAGDLTDFAHGGYLTDLRPLLPERLNSAIPQRTWRTARIGGGLYGVPFLQEPRVLVADRRLLRRAGIRLPTVRRPWDWAEFEAAARALTRDRGGGRGRRYGVAWAMKEPVSQSVNLALSTGGRVFHRAGGRDVVRFGPRDSAVAELIHRQVHRDRTAAPSGLGMSGSDVLPGFFAGRYAMVPLNFSYRQQVHQQAPEGFDWVTLPLPAGNRGGRGAGGSGSHGGRAQGVSPQTLSIARDCRHKRAAMEFVAFLTGARQLVRLARGDWLVPTATAALAAPALHTERYGWRTGTESARHLVASPVLGVRGYQEWLDKIATPAFQEYYADGIALRELRGRLVEDGNRVLARYQR